MAYKIFESNLSAATVQGLTVNHYYWIDRQGNVVDVGGNALVATVAVPAPGDQAISDTSMGQAVEMITQHGVLTGAAGGKLSIAEISPELPSVAVFTGAPVVVGATTTDQALAATAEALRTSVVAPYSGARLIRIAVAILFTTAPSAGTGIKVQLWGHRDGQDRARG